VVRANGQIPMIPAGSVVINGRFLDQPLTGVQRYALEMCRAIDHMIATRHPAVDGLNFLAARPRSGMAPYPFRHIEEVRFGRVSGYAWEQIELPWHTRSAVLINLCNLCPLLGTRNVTVVADANVWLIPDNYSLPFRSIYRVLIPLGIRRSDDWVTMSQYSASQLLLWRIDAAPRAWIFSMIGRTVAAWVVS
jgi:hypothetical protein